jgi:hypothetical protein
VGSDVGDIMSPVKENDTEVTVTVSTRMPLGYAFTGEVIITLTFLISKPITLLLPYTYLYGQRELFERFTTIHLDMESSTI